MKKKLTDLFVKGIKPTAARQAFWDSQSDCLRLVVHPTGRKVWTWLGSIDGKRTTLTLGLYPGHSINDARTWANGINDAKADGLPIPGYKNAPKEIDEGDRPFPHRAKKGSPSESTEPVKDVNWLWALYVQKEGPTLGKRTLAERQRCYTKHIQPAIGDKLITEVRRTDLVSILRAKEEAGFGALSNNLCAYIRRLFRWAVRDAYDLTLLENDPAANLIKLAPPSERDRYLTDDEIGYFFRALPVLEETFAEVLVVALYTGMRRSEVFGLRWEEVKLADRWLDIPKERIKNGLPLILPLPQTVVDILTARRLRTGNYLYVWPAVRSWSEEPDVDEEGQEIDESKVVNNFSRPVKRLNAECQRLAKLDGKTMKAFTIHDLRRTLSSGMHALKDSDDRSLVPTDIVERVINHVIGGVRGTYNRHDYRVEKREALNHWAQHLDKIRLSALAATQAPQTEAIESLVS